jgi:site-specific DNA recombinase
MTKKRSNLKPLDQIKRVVIYTRVSTSDQADNDLSLPAQGEALRRYAGDHGWEVVEEYEERGRSGRTSRRPEFQRMLADLSRSDDRPKVDAILVLYSSRFMRNVEESLVTKRLLERRGVRVISARQPPVEKGAMGGLIEKVFEAIDEYESDINAERTLAAMMECARQGFFPGAASRAPFGFTTEAVSLGGEVTRRRLVPAPSDAEQLRTMLRLYIEVRGALRAARRANDLGLRMRNGRPWNKDGVLRLLDETAAIGRYVFGKGTLDPDECVTIKVEPIVDEVLWEQAQRVRREVDPKVAPGRTGSSPMLLAGLLRCARCGAAGTLETAKAGAYRYYGCRRTQNDSTSACAGFRLPEQRLDRAVLDYVGSHLFTVDRCRSLLKDAVEEAGALQERVRSERRDLRRQLDDITRRLSRYEEQFEVGGEDLQVVLPRIKELRAEKERLVRALESLVAVQRPAPHLYTDEAIGRFQRVLRDAFSSGDGMTRTYLKTLFARIETDGAVVRLVGKGDGTIRVMDAANGGSGSIGSEFSVPQPTGSHSRGVAETRPRTF